MATTAVVLFTRDLRVHDHPALTAAAATADRVVPLFVLDDAILGHHAAPNRVTFLLDSLRDLRSSLRARGGDLVVRRGDVVAQVREICRAVDADVLHASADVSWYAQRRERELAAVGDRLRQGLHLHPGVTIVPPGELHPAATDHYRIFTPYLRRWAAVRFRTPVPAPGRVRLPEGLETGRLPALAELVDGEPSPRVPRGGEARGRALLETWFAGGIAAYETARDDLAAAATSHLSPHLHFGTVSAAEAAARIDRRRSGHEAFLRQLCWRDFNHQLTWAFPAIGRTDYRPRGDDWHDEEDAVAAWKAGRTGYPIVDAGMRQLRTEGYMHNRARMIVASFLTKHLYVDWRVGARHFRDLLVDGDVANNAAQWQWVAGTGTDTRPNRFLNPVAQSRRHDPTGAYLRRWVPELRDLGDDRIHAPWTGPDPGRGPRGYPAPIVDHDEARTRFLAARGAG